MKDSELLEQISNKLSALIALSFMKEADTLTNADEVKTLMRFNLSNQDISDIVGTTKRTVEVLKSRITKENK